MSESIEVLQAQIAHLQRNQRRLTLGCAATGLLTMAALMMGATSQRSASFDVIDAQRINIKEPDGTLRLAISNRTLFPGVVIHNKEQPHPRPMAGMLFFNDEGTENGGLIYNGSLDKSGKPSSGMSLTFDRYQQDQQMQLLGVVSNLVTVPDTAAGLKLVLAEEPLEKSNPAIFQLDIPRKLKRTTRTEWFRIWPGHERTMQRLPSVSPWSSAPSASTSSG